MPNPQLSDAIKEAYAFAPSDDVILHTLELRHPSFVDEQGDTTAIRVVRDNQNLIARLEDSAPLNPNQQVEFIAMGFDIELPKIDTAPVPEITITLDNVSRELVKHLTAASTSQDVIEVTYRPFLSSDTTCPQMDPPMTLILTEVQANLHQVIGRARMLDIGNKAFPNKTYTVKDFPGLGK